MATEVITGLTSAADPESAIAANRAPAARDIVVEGSLDEIQDAFERFAWSDGLPIIPPTLDRVDAFVAHVALDPDKVLGVLAPEQGEATIWNVAVNGVMAGCQPEMMPVLVAIAEAIADPVFQLENAGSTSGLEPLVIVSGPIVSRLDFNAGQGVTRLGRRANSSLGRFLRLLMRNVAGFRIPPGTHDMATFGTNFNVALAEDDRILSELGWPPLAADRGFPDDADVVTVLGSFATSQTAPAAGDRPEELLRTVIEEIGETLWAKGAPTGMAWGVLHPVLVLSPAVARPIAAAGWTKDDVRCYLADNTLMRADVAERALRADGTSLSFREWVDADRLPGRYARTDDPGRLVPVVLDPDDIVIVVAGSPHRNHVSGYLQHGGYGSPVSRPVRL